MKKIKIIITSAGMTFLPIVAFAAGINANNCNNPGGGLLCLVDTIAGWLAALLLGVGVVFLILSGFYFIFARGDEGKLGTARSMLLWSIVGIGVGLLAKYFVGTLISLLGNMVQ